MSGMTDIERLVAIDAIKMLKAQRDYAVDTKDWATYEALHAPDHRSNNDGHPAWNSAAEVVANTRRILADCTSSHHSHTPQITFSSPTQANGIWGMEDNIFWKQGNEDHWLQGFGFYHETYEKRDGNWLFTTRQLKRLHIRTSEGALFGDARLQAVTAANG